MAPPKRQSVKGKTIATTLDPILESVEGQSTRPAPLDSMVTRGELEQVMNEMSNRFAAQQEALVDHLMTRLGGTERSDDNARAQAGSQSGESRGRDQLPTEEETNHNTAQTRNRNKAQPEDGLGRPAGVGPSREEPSTLDHVTFRTDRRHTGGNREYRRYPTIEKPELLPSQCRNLKKE